MNAPLARLNRLLRKPPGHIARRLLAEARHELYRFTVPRRGRSFSARQLIESFNAASIDELWERLHRRPAPYAAQFVDRAAYQRAFPGSAERIIAAAERACAHEIDLMGSGPVQLGPKIDWHRDFKTGDRWPRKFFRSIDYVNKGRPSDAKTVWELSRMQWLVAVGQAYLLTREERYATSVRDVLEQWMAENPYACSVNWGVTIEPALRIFTWIWFFRVFAQSPAWADRGFRERFLTVLFLHGEFTERFFERNDINGNHFTADAAGLLAAGAFFRGNPDADRWLEGCRDDLEREILLQVFPDGVDFEAPAAYHRLVAELLLHASIWANVAGKPFGAGYLDRLRKMAWFTASYTRSDGSTPLWGDADDARVLPFGTQPVTDHRYLVELIGAHLDDTQLTGVFAPSEETYWTFPDRARAASPAQIHVHTSQAFADGGVYVMRNDRDHVFIDCGPLGLAGRGGHGHNDLLSFEAMLDGELLVVDSGSYLYSASFAERNLFRSTRVHNTPQIDGEEINRYIHPDYLWNLHNDAAHEVREWRPAPTSDRIVMSHSGYMRLASPVRPVRRIELDHRSHELLVRDEFTGEGSHAIRVPLQLAPGVEAAVQTPGVVRLTKGQRGFDLLWTDAAQWRLQLVAGRVSPRYGVALPAVQLEWTRNADLRCLEIRLRPVARA
jgi:hypothetical protein